MLTKDQTKDIIGGVEFLHKNIKDLEVFIPEDRNEDHKMIEETVKQFVIQEVIPVWDRLEKQEFDLTVSLMEKMGALGLLGTHMPEYLGGLEMDAVSNTIISENIGPSGGFSVSYNAHTGIGMLPILFFGTEQQKEKYIPSLITGEHIACYCLTEPGSGSDALAAKTKAVLSDDGKHYILNGQKMWISNAGFADIFIVFAQVDGKDFTAFIAEREMDGLKLGEEEKKMGIKSSSTRQVFLEQLKVPVENVLGEIGKGHLIAFNVLNTGRYKLGASCLGGMKKISDKSIQYANERIQFGMPISSFGAIQYKLAEQAIRCFTTECTVYRIAGLIDEWAGLLKEKGYDYAQAKLKAAREFALECSIVKVMGSESLDYCVDEAVQIFGGMGYSEEGFIAQAYRDSRINRIFEGTNEINRLLMVNLILKKAMKGEFDLASPALAIKQELMNGEAVQNAIDDNFYPDERKAVQNFKKVFFMILGAAAGKAVQGELDLKSEQEIILNISDVLIDCFAAESILLRLLKLRKKKMERDSYQAIMYTYFHDTNSRIAKNALDAVAGFVRKEKLGQFVAGIRKLCAYPLQNVKMHRRQIAGDLISLNSYFH